MRLKKKSTSIGILGKILNAFSNSQKDTYSCDYINNMKKEILQYVIDNTRRLMNYTQLEDGADLNSILQFGTFKSIATSHTQTMQNVPSEVTGGFVLYVTSWTATTTNPTYRRQELIYGANTFVRSTNNGGQTWTSWKKVVIE